MTNLRRPATSGFLSRLGVRLVVTFGLALLPLAILSYVQTRQYEQESNARAEAAVLGATLQRCRAADRPHHAGARDGGGTCLVHARHRR